MVVGVIVFEVFSVKVMYGGFLGCLMLGIKCVVFLNEVGVGLVVIVYLVVKMDELVSEGIVVLFELFIDMVVVCIMIVLVVVVIGVYVDFLNVEVI